MTEQLFKKNISNERFYNFLQGFCEEETINKTKYFVLSKTAFKKLKYKNLLLPFCEEMRGYYHHSKSKYVDNVKTFNKFITIIRQICTVNDIVYINKTLYILNLSMSQYITYLPKFQMPAPSIFQAHCCFLVPAAKTFWIATNTLTSAVVHYPECKYPT